MTKAVLFAVLSALAGIFGILLHLESRASAQAGALTALNRELTRMRSDREPVIVQAPAEVRAPEAECGLNAGAIQAIARSVDALQAKRAAASATSDSKATDAPSARTDAQEQALADATETVHRAAAQGRLSREDFARMKRDFETGHPTSAERDALRSEIAVAINSQKLAIEDPRFVYP